MMRSEKWKFGLIGSRCLACGTPQLAAAAGLRQMSRV
jgi:hypothetical protein